MSLFRLSAVLVLAIACKDKGSDSVDTGPVDSEDTQDSEDSDSDSDSDSDTDAPVDADGDGYDADVDCDDDDASIHPDAAEVCDGVDQDCDSVADDDASDMATWYADADEDGSGNADAALLACDQPPGAVAAGDDCDDQDPAIHPGADESDCTDPVDYNCDGSVGYSDDDGDGFAACEECDDTNATVSPDGNEICNAVDDNCDGFVDEGAADASTYYQDVDGDGYGDAGVTATGCEAPEGFVDNALDCDDARADVNPGEVEVCDDLDLDEDCTGTADDADAGVDASTLGAWYADTDSDGYGDDAAMVASCDTAAGYVADNTDCDDTRAAFHPGADESDCTDPADYNCDGSTGYVDDDGDGFAACEECDDASPAVNPSAVETCNGFDDDCNGTIDDSGAVGEVSWYLDSDSDGFGSTDALEACDAPTSYVDNADDCDDGTSSVSPDAAEACNTIDDDCDGDVDEAGAIDEGTWYLDADVDGYGSDDPADMLGACSQPAGYVGNADDCDDGATLTNPGELETCNSVDDDCDGLLDEDDAVDAFTWYLDGDSDGFGDEGVTYAACEAPAGYTSVIGDCDDATNTTHPGADEHCDGVDSDCSGVLDDVYALDASSWYLDADTDGHGDASAATRACAAPSGYSDASDDCNDGDSAIYPGAPEHCDGTDHDCDTLVDEADSVDASFYYVDDDGDGHGHTDVGSWFCDMPVGYADINNDCNDGDPTISPDADEYCDGVDNNCDHSTDGAESLDASTWYLDADTDGYGSDTTLLACAMPTEYVANTDDCDDGSSDVSPVGVESCNGVDDDCDGDIDETGTADGTFYYLDSDGDGFGDAEAGIVACSLPEGYSLVNTDCDDSNAALYPDGEGVCAQGSSCADAFDNGWTTDGLYTIDVDGPEGGTAAYDAWCDMTEDGGGWTLLLSANGASTTWGNNSPAWTSSSFDGSAPPATLTDADYKSEAYVDLDTSEIRICYDGTSRCYTFNHGYSISLYDFFADGITYVDYSSGMYGIADGGSSSTITDYLADLGFTQHTVTCTWLGINDTRSISSIGLLGDWNGGCNGSGVPYSDDLAIGVGLQSCYDANGCNNGGTSNAAGQSRGLDGVDDSGVFGPWHVFGR